MPFPPSGFQFNLNDARREKRAFGDAAGYGLELPAEARRKIAENEAENPEFSIERCLVALQDVLTNTMGTYDAAPWLAVPFRGRRRVSPLIRAVLNVSAAIDPAANAAGIALAAANSTIAPVLVLTPTAANEPLDLFTIECPGSYTVRLDTWGIAVMNAPQEALVVGVRGSTTGGIPDPPRPGVSSYQAEQHQKAEGLVSENKSLAVTVRNLTNVLAAPFTPLLIYFSASWWEFPVNRWVDAKDQTRLRSGYGVECRR